MKARVDFEPWRAPVPSRSDRGPTARHQRAGRYELLDVIGCGGFSLVHQGYDPLTGLRVAIKVCEKRDRESRARFLREAAIGSSLDHVNITKVFDLGADGSTLYLVQEYLGGQDLADLIHRGLPNSLSKKLDILVQVASGLTYAHSKGVLHRDIKPGNVRVLDDGLVKIMDFGSAKRPSMDAGLTQIGTILGTLAYMPPECLSGQPPAASADIYSFGVLAYELLASRRPFAANRLLSLLHQVKTTSPPPLTKVQPGCPDELAEVVHRCLSRVPEDRPGAATLRRDLSRLQARHALGARAA